MGDLVQIDFNTFKRKQDDFPSFPEPSEEETASGSTGAENDNDDHMRRKLYEERLYRKTLRRVRQDIRRSNDHKKEKAYSIVKRLFDISAAATGVAFLSPLLAGLAVTIKLSDGGQPIFSQVRLGKNGKTLRLYKFRSMRIDAEDMTKLLTPKQLRQFYTEYKVDNDPRITKIGKFIRKTSLDELPQLFNVLDGDMTLIGPRPIVQGEVVHYKKKLKKLLSVTPGLTGYWQAYARNKATYKDGLRQSMELYYIDNRSLGLDVKIFLKTIISVIKQEGAQ